MNTFKINNYFVGSTSTYIQRDLKCRKLKSRSVHVQNGIYQGLNKA